MGVHPTGRRGDRVVVSLHHDPTETLFGTLLTTVEDAGDVVEVALDHGGTYVAAATSDSVALTLERREQAELEHHAIVAALAELERGGTGGYPWLLACVSNAKRALRDALRPPRHDPDRVRLPRRPPRLRFDEWLVELDAAHVECVCDVTEIERHCATCAFDAPWPCHVRRLLDERKERR